MKWTIGLLDYVVYCPACNHEDLISIEYKDAYKCTSCARFSTREEVLATKVLDPELVKYLELMDNIKRPLSD